MILNLQIFFNIITNCLIVCSSFIASLILTPLLLILLLILTLYRQCIGIILKLRYGNRFSGLLGGADVVHTMEEPSKAIISCLLITACDNSLPFYDNAITFLTQFWFKTPDSFPKFKSIFLKTMGYSYRLKDQLKPEECLRKMKIIKSQGSELNKTELMELIADCCNSPLPKNEQVLWEILIGTQPIKWNPDNQTKSYYPVLFRVHHGVADGVSLLKLLVGIFADSPYLEIVSSSECKEMKVSKRQSAYKSYHSSWTEAFTALLKHGRYVLGHIYTVIQILIMYPAISFIQLVLKCNDSNILYGPALTGQKVLALTVEETPKYIQKIKRIKSKVTGASFSDILLTAFSASLRDYYAKKSKQQPEYISTLVPLFPGSLELQHMVPGQLNENTINFRNGYSFILARLPLFVPYHALEEQMSLLNRLKLIKNDMNIIKNAVDYKVNYFMMCVVGGFLPQPVIRLILKGSHCTTLISIIAGPQNMTFGRGIHTLEGMAFWVPHVKNIGVSFSVLTYNNRLHVGLSADKALISHQSDAQSIVDGVFKYLDDMESELSEVKSIEEC